MSESPHYASGLSDPAYARSALYEQYQEWQGVPYRTGGESRRGVDCSAFMQLTFREQFAMQLPRDTDSQAHIVAQFPVAINYAPAILCSLILASTRHVGVMVEKINSCMPRAAKA